jgi:hypothetical protein
LRNRNRVFGCYARIDIAKIEFDERLNLAAFAEGCGNKRMRDRNAT